MYFLGVMKMASQNRSSKRAQPFVTSTCFKTELSKLIAKCLPSMNQFYSSDGLDNLDIDQGYSKQYDCDKYWHSKH